MSIAEIAPESSPIYSFTFPVLGVAGKVANTAPIPNYAGSCSQMIGVTVVTAGVGGPQKVTVVQGANEPGLGPPAVAGFGTLTLYGEGVPGVDTSTYRVYWTNKVAQSQAITVYSC